MDITSTETGRQDQLIRMARTRFDSAWRVLADARDDAAPRDIRLARSEAKIGVELLRQAREASTLDPRSPGQVTVRNAVDGIRSLDLALQSAPDGSERQAHVAEALGRFDLVGEGLDNDLA